MRPVCLGITFGLCITSAVLAADDSLDQLIQALDAPDKQARLTAIDEIADLGAHAKPAVAALQAALASDDVDTRWHAARTLGAIGPDAKPAAAALVKSLDDPDPRVKTYAAYALGQMDADDEAIVRRLMQVVLDDDVTVRRAAIHALRKIDPPQEMTAPLVAQMLEKADPELVTTVIKTLAEDGEAAVPRLSKALEHPQACYWACLALQEIGPAAKDAVPNLRKVIEHEQEECRMQALMALAEIGPASAPAKDDIIHILETDKFGGVQFAAAYALGKIGEKEGANEALQKTIQSEDEFLRTVSAWALARINRDDKQIGMRSAEIIVAGLKSQDNHVRAAAARALAEFDGYEGVVGPALVDALKDSDPVVVGNALDALGNMGPAILPGIERGLKNPELRGMALRVIQRMGENNKLAVPALVQTLTTEDVDNQFRTQAQYTLGLIGPAAEPALGLLLKSLTSDDEHVRRSAIFALAKMGPAARPAGRELVKILEGESQDTFDRLASGWALLEITNNDPRIARTVVPLLIAGLDHEDPSIRIEAAKSLGDLGQHGQAALPALKKLAQIDPDHQVRAAAEAAIAQLQP